MPTITGLEPQQRDPERVNVYLDGAFVFGVSATVVYARHLAVGSMLSEGEIEDLRSDDEREKAFAAALNFLSFRPRSRREIELYLRKRSVPDDIVGEVLERLQRIGLIDDAEFARYWVENRQTFRPRGAMALRAEMRQKGLDADSIDAALSNLGDEEETAVQAGLRKARSLSTADERDFFRTLVAFLQRRGFPYAIAAEATKHLYRQITERETEEMDLNG